MDLNQGDDLPLRRSLGEDDGPDSPTSACDSSSPSSPSSPQSPTNGEEPSIQNASIKDGESKYMYDHYQLTDFDEYLDTADFQERHDFMMDPLPEGSCIQCRLVREKVTGFASPLKRRQIMFKSENGFLFAATKKKGAGGEYIISLENSEMMKDSKNYLGKLTSNVTGSECIGYDCGMTPKSTGILSPLSRKKNTLHPEDMREELVAIRYMTNRTFSRGPRKMRIVIPRVEEEEESGNKAPREGLLSADKRSRKDDSSPGSPPMSPRNITGNPVTLGFSNREPVKSPTSGRFVLDFSNRVEHASVKNFQITSDTDDVTVLQFGRMTDDEFSLDFAHPFSPFQALCIGLSSMGLHLLT